MAQAIGDGVGGFARNEPEASAMAKRKQAYTHMGSRGMKGKRQATAGLAEKCFR